MKTVPFLSLLGFSNNVIRQNAFEMPPKYAHPLHDKTKRLFPNRISHYRHFSQPSRLSITKNLSETPNNEQPPQYLTPPSIDNIETAFLNNLNSMLKLSNRDIENQLNNQMNTEQKSRCSKHLLSLLVSNDNCHHHNLIKATDLLPVLDPDQHYRQWFADQLYTHSPDILCENIEALKLDDITKARLFIRLEKQKPIYLLKNFRQVFQHHIKQKDILLRLADRCPSGFFKYCDTLKLTQSYKIKFIDRLLPKAPKAFAKHILSLNLSSAQMTTYALKLIKISPEALNNYLDLFDLNAISFEQQKEMLEILFQPLFPSQKSWISRKIDSDSLGTYLSIGCAIKSLKSIEAVPLIKHPKIIELIQSISNLDGIFEKDLISNAFIDLLNKPTDQQNEYMQLTAKLSRYGLMQAIVIQSITENSSLSINEKQTLYHDLGLKGFKNAFKFSKLIDFLFAVAHLKEQKALIPNFLLAICPTRDNGTFGKEEMIGKVLTNINYMQALIHLINCQSCPENINLSSINSPNTLINSIKNVALEILMQDDTKTNRDHIEQYFNRSKDPSHLLVWVACQREYIDQTPTIPKDNLNIVRQISHWILANSTQARFSAQKYNIDLKNCDTTTHQKWQTDPIAKSLQITPKNFQAYLKYDSYQDYSTVSEIEFEELYEPNNIDKFDKLLSATQDNNWIASITSNLEQLLSCGTDIPGSCQHVNAEGYLNQGLMGYIKYGKMATLYQNNRLVARNMLFLGKDLQTDKYLLIMASNMYSQPNCHEGHRELLKITSQRYADWLGIELIDAVECHDDPFPMKGSDTREIVIPIDVPTYTDEFGICTDDISFSIQTTSHS